MQADTTPKPAFGAILENPHAEQLPDPNLLFVASPNEEGYIINLATVRVIDEIRDGNCRLVFSPEHTVTLQGGFANEFMAVMGRRVMLPTGEPLKAALDRITASRQSPESEQP